MNPQPKRQKRNLVQNNLHPFPVNTIESDYKFSGYFTGLNVEVFEVEAIKSIFENGSFGIGSKTQAAPKVLWEKNLAPTRVSNEILSKKCEWRQQTGSCESEASVGIVGKSEDNVTEMDFDDQQNVKSKLEEVDPYQIEETLVLTLEESFFLHHTLKCLRVMDVDGKDLQTNDLLLKFCSLKRHFLTHFVAYLYLRSKNWIVKCGLKFGGDFLLYKEGPRYYHASYIVLVRRSNSSEHSRVHQLHGHYRTVETSKKELLILEIYYPKQLAEETNPVILLENLNLFHASEMTMKRFDFQQEH